jgi:hypothetical protein
MKTFTKVGSMDIETTHDSDLKESLKFIGALGSRLRELEQSPTPAKVRSLMDDIQTWLLDHGV